MKKQILKTVYTLLCCIFLFIPVIQSKEKPLELQINPYTGAISGLKIPGDKQNMEWLWLTIRMDKRRLWLGIGIFHR